MAFTESIKKAAFWANVTKVGLIFLIIISIVALFVYSFSDIFSMNWEGVVKTKFENGRWKNFFVSKIVISFVYASYITNKNMK
ncbi:MAG: hypothetical protein JKY02_10590 [Flavobacteriaceae bacterium]|nr:hypothetical protein [Flavobacteriaceae bacterium]